MTNAQGTYVVNPDTGAVTFTPVRGFRGVASLPYVVSDMDARVATANLFIEVSSVSTTSAPVAMTPTTTTSTTPVARTPANKQKATTLPKTDGSKMPKTGGSRLYALGEIAILTYLTGTGLVSANKWKRRKSDN